MSGIAAILITNHSTTLAELISDALICMKLAKLTLCEDTVQTEERTFNMPPMNAQNVESLRAAIAWALQLADSHDQSLIAAYLADALHLAENLKEQDPE